MGSYWTYWNLVLDITHEIHEQLHSFIPVQWTPYLPVLVSFTNVYKTETN